MIRGQPPHDELPCRRRDARDARLARRVERDAVPADAPQLGVGVLCEVDGLLCTAIRQPKNRREKVII